ncbi:hypothetical protein LXA43DRAFT_654325 [Ganoderma leucocontextum]|nr:hypothetical protein LXA43DRAFT_654325 [Ganoderma leucocontextum]
MDARPTQRCDETKPNRGHYFPCHRSCHSGATPDPQRGSLRDAAPTNPPPRTPRCKQCKQPRRGHDKSGCPNVNPPIPPRNTKEPRQRTPRMVPNPGYNIINQQQVNITVENNYHESPTAPPALGGQGTPPSSGPEEPPSATSTRTTTSGPPSEDHWGHIHALLRAHPMSVVTIAMAHDDFASEELVAQQHGYAVKLIYPEDSWEDPDQGLFIIARDAAALGGTYNRVRKAANGGTSLVTIVREESYERLGDTFKSVVDAMAELDVEGSQSQGSRKSRRSRKTRT